MSLLLIVLSLCWVVFTLCSDHMILYSVCPDFFMFGSSVIFSIDFPLCRMVANYSCSFHLRLSAVITALCSVLIVIMWKLLPQLYIPGTDHYYVDVARLVEIYYQVTHIIKLATGETNHSRNGVNCFKSA